MIFIIHYKDQKKTTVNVEYCVNGKFVSGLNHEFWGWDTDIPEDRAYILQTMRKAIQKYHKRRIK